MKVSVIIPTYQRSECIQRAVDSVLSQTLSDIEVIVVDDNGIGTTDGLATQQAMIKYINNEKVIYIQHTVNKNGAAARNTGLKIAKGDYISFLDDDDIYLPERLELLSSRLDSLDETWGLCYSSYIKRMPNGKIQRSNEKVQGNIFHQVLMRSFYLGSGANIFIRKNVIQKIGMFDEAFRRNQDLEFLVRATQYFKVAYVEEVLMEINYDIRTCCLSFNDQEERENMFRQKFSKYLSTLPTKEAKSVFIMWNIDWIRLCIESKQYRAAMKHIFNSKIPVRVFVSYMFYIIDRCVNNTSYGFVVKI